MKKFLLGILCGLVLFSTVYASESLSVKLFPSQIKFHINGTIKDLDSETQVLNYNNRAYIPLRDFVETIGAKISFQQSSQGLENQNLIDIYMTNNAPSIDFLYEDAERYVSIGELQYGKDKNNNTELIGGTIRINKDLNGKRIILCTDNNTQEYAGFGTPIYILNELSEDLKAGEIRQFRVPSEKIGEFKSLSVSIADPVISMEFPTNNFATSPLSFNGGVFSIPRNIEDPIFFHYCIVCTDTSVCADPFEVILEVYKIDSNLKETEMVFRSTLPSFGGNYKNGYGYFGHILWNKRDINGKYVDSGQYKFKFILPDKVSYKIIGDTVQKTLSIEAPLGGGENTFEIDTY